VLTQIDPGPPVSFEVTVGKLLARAHGTLFDVIRKKEEVKVTAFEGSVVTTSQGVVEMAKARQIMKFDHGRFRYKHYMKTEDEGRLEDWKGLLAETREKHPQVRH
jgi:ferric-dicitrate binding protein FerR (iron transport regulator)